MADDAALTPYRAEGAKAAVLFVHGFGSRGKPFGHFPQLLAEEPALDGWDMYGLGYSTGLMPDIGDVWEADPPIEVLATYLRTRARLAPLSNYGSIAVVAHSMGGLVTQKALVDDPEFAERVSHAFFFGTPSAGVRAAGWGGFLKRQVDDMAEDGEFVAELRARWDELYGAERPFSLHAVAGDRDAFVPAHSCLSPFPPEAQFVVPGNHLEIVGIEAPGSMSQQVVVEALVGGAAPAGPWNSARVAVERNEFERAIRELMPHAAELDERHLVDLALALEATGRRDDAIGLLQEHAGVHGTDAKGALAGRLKRSWRNSGLRAQAESAFELYSEALEAASAAGDHEQAYYHAINVAFFELVYKRNRRAAQDSARRALDHCAEALDGFWRRATEAEAQLHLGARDAVVAAWTEALAFEPRAHELESAYGQASQIIATLGDRELQAELDRLLRPVSLD